MIATYQVMDVDPRRSGPTTFATRLYSLYVHKGRHNPEKLRHHHTDNLVRLIKSCHSKGDWIMLAGDLNKVLGTSMRGLTKLHSKCGLINTVLDKHSITDFTSYQRGHQVIDYILCQISEKSVVRPAEPACINLCRIDVVPRLVMQVEPRIVQATHQPDAVQCA